MPVNPGGPHLTPKGRTQSPALSAAIRLAHHPPTPKTVVVHETLANLSKLPAVWVGLIEAYCRKEIPSPVLPSPIVPDLDASSPTKVHVGPCYGLLAGLHALARELGLVAAVGEATRQTSSNWNSITPEQSPGKFVYQKWRRGLRWPPSSRFRKKESPAA